MPDQTCINRDWIPCKCQYSTISHLSLILKSKKFKKLHIIYFESAGSKLWAFTLFCKTQIKVGQQCPPIFHTGKPLVDPYFHAMEACKPERRLFPYVGNQMEKGSFRDGKDITCKVVVSMWFTLCSLSRILH